MEKFGWIGAFFICLAVMITSCAKVPPKSRQQMAVSDNFNMEEAESRSMERASFAKRPPGIAPAPPLPGPIPEQNAGMAAEPRMIFREGQITYRTPEPEKILDSASQMIKKARGYVERRTQNTLVVRIPVALFDSLFEKLKNISQVIYHFQRAEDITEQYSDTQLEIRILEKSLERLQELVAETEDPEQKVRLLEEIRQISEKLARFKAIAKVLEKKADFSKLTLRTEQPVIDPMRRRDPYSIAAFNWMSSLGTSPGEPRELGDQLELEVPQGMIEVKDHSPWLTSAADGSRFWANELKNQPKGETKFWINALEHKLSRDYKEVTRLTSGKYQLLRMVPHGPQPYVYITGIYAEDCDLKVVEIYFPSQIAEKRHWENVNKALEKSSG